MCGVDSAFERSLFSLCSHRCLSVRSMSSCKLTAVGSNWVGVDGMAHKAALAMVLNTPVSSMVCSERLSLLFPLCDEFVTYR